jgi:hypothetical protein
MTMGITKRYRLHAWELVEVEQYLHGEPVNFKAMKQYNHHIRMQVFRASARGFVAGLFLALIAIAVLRRVLPGMGLRAGFSVLSQDSKPRIKCLAQGNPNRPCR